ncbi:unnamed protein product [Strongylus vulgaris]|uniref:Uncharacterized protein n=1 Tax=Strongylus vulgaris TaxID=40348 RepID=A0A3P7IXE9_STRVU|nr:unnamed protein product [Strongylus vulgaris]
MSNKVYRVKARASPGSDAHSSPTGANKALRLATINLGTHWTTSRIGGFPEKTGVDIACTQETKWKGRKSRDIGDDYKHIYNDTSSSRIEVGITVSESLRSRIAAVDRLSDRLMSIKIDTGRKSFRIVTAYAPQTGCKDEEKNMFWQELDDFTSIHRMRYSCLEQNGHIGEKRNDDTPSEFWKDCGWLGASWLASHFNQIIKAKSMLHDWSNSTTIPIWKNKGDIADCSTYRPIRLMSHTLKIFGRVLEKRLRAIIKLPSNQCGFVKGAGTADAIHTVRTVMEKYREKRRELHAAFLDMENAFDKVPHDVIWWALRKHMVPEVYIQWIKMIYHGATSQMYRGGTVKIIPHKDQRARRNNLADVASKDGSQETMVNVTALIASLIMLPLVSGHHTLIWFLFMVFTAVHLYANYRAVRALNMETLNLKRATILIRSWLSLNSIPSIQECNEAEPLFYGFGTRYLGCPLRDLLSYQKRVPSAQLRVCDYYILLYDTQRNIGWVALNDGSPNLSPLNAVFDIEVLASKREVKTKEFETFAKELSAKGWKAENANLGFDEWTFTRK